MKSTQDLNILLNRIASLAQEDLLSIEIFTDKSFRIMAHGENRNDTIYEPDLSDMDINDLGYYTAEEIVAKIKESKEEENDKPLKLSDLQVEHKPVVYKGGEL